MIKPLSSRTEARERKAPTGVDAKSRWLVLVVDDEPDVHEMTRMLLSSTRFCGLPVELHSVYSAEAARAFLREHEETALVLLDVVMETDDAGLRLIRYIRDELRNTDVQIVLRTGQPGQAPEQDVISDYDINGYFLKTEITAKKLHSIVISALRAYNYIKALKQHRPNGPAVYDKRLMVSAERRTELAERLRTAMEQDQLNLDARPQIELKSGRIVGMEILPRWQTAAGVEVSPRQLLLPAAEHAGLIGPLGDWVLWQACTLTKAWHDEGLGPFRAAVNITGTQLRDSDFVESVECCLKETGLCPTYLELELAETALLQEPRITEDALQRLRTLGVSFTVDDFGTGMASLAQLKRLQPNRLKIDRSFVHGLAEDPDSSAITRAIIALAHTLGMSVIADGVQTKEQLEFLKWEECETGQGDFFAPALPTSQLAEFIRSYRTAAVNSRSGTHH